MAPRKTAAKAAAAPEVEEAVEETVVETVPESEPAGKGGSVTVTWPGGAREFSKEIHGADFKKLAAEFAAKHGGKVA